MSGGIVVGVSGTGSNLRALASAADRGALGAKIVLVFADREGSLERRRRAQSHLRIAATERSDPPAGVATVCGSVRPVEARLYRQVLHRG